MEIKDIPKHHHRILDNIWKCKSNSELRMYLSILPPSKLMIAQSLIEMIRLHILDEHFEAARESHLDVKFTNYFENILRGKNDTTS